MRRVLQLYAVCYASVYCQSSVAVCMPVCESVRESCCLSVDDQVNVMMNYCQNGLWLEFISFCMTNQFGNQFRSRDPEVKECQENKRTDADRFI